MKENLIRRTWTGKWIEPVQEPAYREPELTFEEMVAAEQSGIPGEEHLKCAKHLHRVIKAENADGELPVSAVLYASAHGVYDLYINGAKADQRLLAPETTNYKKLLWYQKYDISDRVCESDRICVDVLLGDGWWIGHLGMSGANCNYGSKLGFLMDLELTYPDGSVTVIGSDEQFLSCDSFIRYSDLFVGEMQDGRAFDFIDGSRGCPPRESIMDDQFRVREYEDEPNVVSPGWKNCVCAKHAMDILAQQTQAPVQVIREIPSQGYVDNPAKDLIADFGQVLAGTVRIRVRAERGAQITIEHGEVLDQNGNYFNNIKGLFKDQKTRYICGGGEQTFVPHFTYHGFRYIRITGIDPADVLELTALVYGTPLDRLGFFETDHEGINALQTAIENSTISNMISIPTDCPQREKLGWTGDISLFTQTGGFLYDLREMLKNWLLQVRLDQFPDGEIPVVVPNHPCQEQMQRGMSGGTNSSAAWSDCCIFMPLKLYCLYGDRSFLEDNYKTMEKWMSYVEGQAKGYLWDHRFHFGDWLIPSLREAPDGVMKGVMATSDIAGSCYYALAAEAMIRICAELNRLDRAEHYRELLGHIRQAIRREYVYDDGRVGVHARENNSADSIEKTEDPQLQGLYVMVLRSSAAQDPELKKKMLERLVKLIRKKDHTLDCGFSSIGFLLDILYDNGYQDVAYRLLFNTNAPSWLYMVEHGATTIWENWKAIREDGSVTDSSYNHYAYGCVGDFMYRHIGGIEIMEPGFSKVRIAPDFGCGIRKSSCIRKLPGQGEIRCEWELTEGDHGTLSVEIPEGVSARIVLPETELDMNSGNYRFRI